MQKDYLLFGVIFFLNVVVIIDFYVLYLYTHCTLPFPIFLPFSAPPSLVPIFSSLLEKHSITQQVSLKMLTSNRARLPGVLYEEVSLVFSFHWTTIFFPSLCCTLDYCCTLFWNTYEKHFTLNYDSRTVGSSQFPLIFSEAKQNKIFYAWFQVCRWSEIVYMGYFSHLIHLGWFYDAVTWLPISTLDICQEGAEIRPLAHFIFAPRSLLKLYLT